MTAGRGNATRPDPTMIERAALVAIHALRAHPPTGQQHEVPREETAMARQWVNTKHAEAVARRRYGTMRVIATDQFKGRCYACLCGWTGWSVWAIAERHAQRCPRAREVRDD